MQLKLIPKGAQGRWGQDPSSPSQDPKASPLQVMVTLCDKCPENLRPCWTSCLINVGLAYLAGLGLLGVPRLPRIGLVAKDGLLLLMMAACTASKADRMQAKQVKQAKAGQASLDHIY